MPNLPRVVLAALAGIIVGSIVNVGLVMIGAIAVPPPDGVDESSVESIRANIGAYSAAQLLPPFIAHAIATVVGAAVATGLNRRRTPGPAIVVGAWFLIGGIAMLVLIPETPAWFAVLDLGVAYLPMAWIGWRLAGGAGMGTV